MESDDGVVKGRSKDRSSEREDQCEKRKLGLRSSKKKSGKKRVEKSNKRPASRLVIWSCYTRFPAASRALHRAQAAIPCRGLVIAFTFARADPSEYRAYFTRRRRL